MVRKIRPEQEQSIVDRYVSGESMPEIGASLGCNHVTILNVLKRHGIPRRSGSEAMRLAMAGKRIDDGMTNSGRMYARRKRGGVCTECKKPASVGRYTCQECRERRIAERKVRAVGGVCTDCGSAKEDVDLKMCKKCRDYRNSHHRRLRDEAFAAYGGYRCVCHMGCGETEPVFLCLDHINEDGAKRREEEGMGVKLYRWLKKHGYPSGFQVLCHNCNFAKHNGGCPGHRRN